MKCRSVDLSNEYQVIMVGSLTMKWSWLVCEYSR